MSDNKDLKQNPLTPKEAFNKEELSTVPAQKEVEASAEVGVKDSQEAPESPITTREGAAYKG